MITKMTMKRKKMMLITTQAAIQLEPTRLMMRRKKVMLKLMVSTTKPITTMRKLTTPTTKMITPTTKMKPKSLLILMIE